MDDDQSEESFGERSAEEAYSTAEERLLRKLNELLRFGANISAELEKDTPCKGVVSRELLHLELGALERDYRLTEKKLGLLTEKKLGLRRSTFEVEPWHGSNRPHVIHRRRRVSSIRETRAARRLSQLTSLGRRSPERQQGMATQASRAESRRAICPREISAASTRRSFDVHQAPPSHGYHGGFPEKDGGVEGEVSRRGDGLALGGRGYGTRSPSSMSQGGGGHGQHSRFGMEAQGRRKLSLSVRVADFSPGVDQRQKQKQQKQQHKEHQPKQRLNHQPQRRQQQRPRWEVGTLSRSDANIVVAGSPRYCGAGMMRYIFPGEPRRPTTCADRDTSKEFLSHNFHDGDRRAFARKYPPTIENHARCNWSWRGQEGNRDSDGSNGRCKGAVCIAPKLSSSGSSDLLYGAAGASNNERHRVSRPPEKHHLQKLGFRHGDAVCRDLMLEGSLPRVSFRAEPSHPRPRREEGFHEEERVAKRARFEIRQMPSSTVSRSTGAENACWSIKAGVRNALESANQAVPVAMNASNGIATSYHIGGHFVDHHDRDDLHRVDDSDTNNKGAGVFRMNDSNDYRHTGSWTHAAHDARGGSRQPDRWRVDHTLHFENEHHYDDDCGRHIGSLHRQPEQQQYAERYWQENQSRYTAREFESDRWHPQGGAPRRLPYPTGPGAASDEGGGRVQHNFVGMPGQKADEALVSASR